MKISKTCQNHEGWWGFSWYSRYHHFSFKAKNWWLNWWRKRHKTLFRPLIPVIGFEFDITVHGKYLGINLQLALFGFDIPIYVSLGKMGGV